MNVIIKKRKEKIKQLIIILIKNYFEILNLIITFND